MTEREIFDMYESLSRMADTIDQLRKQICAPYGGVLYRAEIYDDFVGLHEDSESHLGIFGTKEAAVAAAEEYLRNHPRANISYSPKMKEDGDITSIRITEGWGGRFPRYVEVTITPIGPGFHEEA